MFGNGANYICKMIRTANPGQMIQVVDIQSIIANVFSGSTEIHLGNASLETGNSNIISYSLE